METECAVFTMLSTWNLWLCVFSYHVWGRKAKGCCLLTLSVWEIKPALTQIQVGIHTNIAWVASSAQKETTATCVWLRCHWPLGWVHLGTQTDKCGWVVTPRQLVVKGRLSICALIWQIVFSQASSASLFLWLSVSAWLALVFLSA